MSGGGPNVDGVSEIFADIAPQRLFVTGSFQNTADFNPSGVANLTAPFTSSNAYLAYYRYTPVPTIMLNDDVEAIPTEAELAHSELGIETATAVALKYYPNPTTGMMYLENMSEGALVEMYSMDGSLAGSWISVSTERLTLDLSDLNNGIYMIQVKNADGSVSNGKVILQR